jgi:hypothetical protein
MKTRQPGAGTGRPADSPKQRKQQALAWLLHQVTGAQGNLKFGYSWNSRTPHMPPAVAVRLQKVQSQLKLMERELRYELRNIK